MRTRKHGSVTQCWDQEKQDPANKATCNHQPESKFRPVKKQTNQKYKRRQPQKGCEVEMTKQLINELKWLSDQTCQVFIPYLFSDSSRYEV